MYLVGEVVGWVRSGGRIGCPDKLSHGFSRNDDDGDDGDSGDGR